MPALIVTLFLFFLLLRRTHLRSVLVMLAALMLGLILKGPVLDAMQVTPPDFVESVSIPLQQVARVVKEGRELTEEQEELLSKVVDLERLRSLHLPYISDPVKNEIRARGNAYFEENKGEFLKLWLQLGITYPADYVKAWIDQTRGYWNAGYDYWIYRESVVDNTLDIHRTQTEETFITQAKTAYFGLFDSAALKPFSSVGLHVWILFGACIVFWLKGRNEFLLTVPLITVIGTLWIATPVFCEFRYAYALFTTCPMLLALLGGKKTDSPQKGL
jgi:hypothetical protein